MARIAEDRFRLLVLAHYFGIDDQELLDLGAY